MKKTIFLPFIITLILFSCQQSAPENNTIGTDTSTTISSTPPEEKEEEKIISNYFEELPSLPDSPDTIKSLLVGTWAVGDYKVDKLDTDALPPGTTAETIHDKSMFPISNFGLTANTDHSIVIRDNALADCEKRTFTIINKSDYAILDILCVDNRYGLQYEILGINKSFLYLKEKKGGYPFEVYYMMEKK